MLDIHLVRHLCAIDSEKTQSLQRPAGCSCALYAAWQHVPIKVFAHDVRFALQIMLMEVSDRIREQIGISYPQDGPLQKITAALPSLMP